jgi:hypothetical protein
VCLRLFNLAAAISLILCAATAALWARSFWVGDALIWKSVTGGMGPNSTSLSISSVRGEFSAARIVRHDPQIPLAPEPYHWIWNAWSVDGERDAAFFWPYFYSDRFPATLTPTSVNTQSGVYFEHAFLVSMLLLVPAAATASSFLRARHRCRRKRLRGHCPFCGYDLRATPNCCPECGTSRSAACR